MTVDIKSLTPPELKRFLMKLFEREQLSTGPLEELESEEINGKTLLTLSEDELRQSMPSSKMGHRRVINLFVEKYKQLQESRRTQDQYQNFRQFDSEVKSTDGYYRTRLVDVTVQTRTKKTIPIRNFHSPESKSEEDLKNYILKECACFAAACINEMQNGTIYFGISPDESGGLRKGQVIGLHLSSKDLNHYLPSMFFLNQQDIINTSLKNVKFVPVVGEENGSLHVIEFDVVPQSFLKVDEYIKINSKSIPHPPKTWRGADPVFKFSETGKPQRMTSNDTCSSSRISASTIEQRKFDEANNSKQGSPNLIMQLRNHLTGGLDKMDDELYTFLILSPLMTSSVDPNSLKFIKRLRPEVVFDFNPSGDTGGIYHALDEEQDQVVKVVTLNDFDERQKDRKEIKSFQNELVESKFLNWVFCNGYGRMEAMEAVQWNKKRSQAFLAAFRHYLEQCSKDRVLIIICLFSSDYKALLGACDGVLSELPDQWILLSEKQAMADHWQQSFKMREKIDQTDLRDRCIIGLPWEQINNVIALWCGQEETHECQIPHSSGNVVKVQNKTINEWSDIEVVSTLDPIDLEDDDETIKEKQKQAEENFYRGGQVQWLNFFYSQVCQRKIHDELYNLVSNALEGREKEEEMKVVEVYLFHQPGAGGSTSAKQILWSLRGKYRCCWVKEITNQTIDQLTEIFFFKEDKSPKPILVLLDTADEDKLFQFKVNLQTKLRHVCISDVFCVLLICYRTVSVAIHKRKQLMVKLEQKLVKQDLSLFKKTYKDLELKGQHEDLKFLISFNIMKENFDRSYIQNTVKEFFHKITDENELTILKFISLINNFDIDFKCIPVSCFDCMVEPDTEFVASDGNRKVSWEARVSKSFKVLLNMSANVSERKTIRMFNKIIAGNVLECVISKTHETVGDIMSSLLTSKIFNETGNDFAKLENIISNMVRKRAYKEDGRKETFSPLILHIKGNEGPEKAVEIMETLFGLDDAPFTAQQIARFYIVSTCKNYKKAEEYAKIATGMLPSNSYIWDTYAQVFKAQLVNKVKSESINVEDELTHDVLRDLIALCQKCTDAFRKEQLVSDEEALTGGEEVNLAGYFGELQSIVVLLSALKKCKCFKSKDVIRNFLLDEKYTNKYLTFLHKEEHDYLKTLWNCCKKTISRLDGEFLQMKVEIEANPISSTRDTNKIKLLTLRATVNEYFGESCEEVPPDLSEEDKCKYRWRIIFSKGSSSLSNTLQLKHDGDFNVLNDCYQLMLENVTSKHSAVGDLNSLLDIVTVLLIAGKVPHNLKFEDLIQWSKELYTLSIPTNHEHGCLEVFMYFALYNFPTEERLESLSLAPSQDLGTVLKKWKEFFKAKRNVQRIASRATTLFFLGNGLPMQDIVYQKDLDNLMADSEHHEKWHKPEIRNVLKVLNGILSEKGNFISYSYRNSEGNENWIDINTANRIDKKFWCQKRIYFYLGFSFSGLKAYGVTNENPMAQPIQDDSTKHLSRTFFRKKQPYVLSLGDLENKKQIILQKLSQKKFKHLHSELQRELDGVQRQISEIYGDYV